MKIDCLLGVYGRYSLVCEALACFLQQSKVTNATLLIYNQHPVPLLFDHPRVRVVNETLPAMPLRHIRQRILELSDLSADLIHWWDDDDLYLPWHLEDCLANIEGHVAWKPASSWLSEANIKFTLRQNTFEGSWVFRADYLREASVATHPGYIDHPVFMQTLDAKRLATSELGARTSYIYRWDTGTQHISGFGGSGTELQQKERISLWRKYSEETRPDGHLVPADLTLRWRQYLDGIKGQTTGAEWEANRRGVGLAPKLRDWPMRMSTILGCGGNRHAKHGS